MFYIDWTYIILVMPAVIFSIWASSRVGTTFEKYSKQNSSRRMTGAEAASRVLRANGIYDVRIEKIGGNLTDHYDPKAKVIRLSDAVHDSVSTAAIGVAAHEAGHALQHAEGYGPIKLRMTIIPICNFASSLAMPLFLLGILFSSWNPETSFGFLMMQAGIIAFSVAVFFQVVTLPVEFNASRRAMKALEATGYYTEEELDGARRVLRAAAMTYVAALAVSLLQILRLVILSNNRRR